MRIVITGSAECDIDSIGKLVGDSLGLCLHTLSESAVADQGLVAKRNLPDWAVCVISSSALADPNVRRNVRRNAIVVVFSLDSRNERELEVILPYADIVVDLAAKTTEQAAAEAIDMIGQELAIRFQSANTFGEIIRVTTFGESHGPAIGAVLDGVLPGVKISAEDIQRELFRRRPGQSAVTTPRSESDQVHILSGVFGGKTTGAPIAMVIHNRDQDSSKYEALKDIFRPGHADFTYYSKYGVRDYRGGGRSSGRETAGRVACGAIASKILSERGVRIFAHAVEIAGIRASTCDLDAIESNAVRCADPEAAKLMEVAILEARDEKDSVGGIAQLEVYGVPVGLGDPVFFKLDARLSHAIMSLGAVKGIEIGDGFALASMRGSQSNDQMSSSGFLSNHAGGITGGISTGQPIILRAVVKPTSSIARPQKTIDIGGHEREITVEGRHDPCILPRIIPVIENMTALVILDAWEIQERVLQV